MGKGAPVFEFLSSPFGLVAVGLGVLAVAVLALCLWITTLDRRMRGMADGLETERRKVAELQMVIGRRANAARSYGNRGRAAAPAPAPAPAPASAVAAASAGAPMPPRGAAAPCLRETPFRPPRPFLRAQRLEAVRPGPPRPAAAGRPAASRCRRSRRWMPGCRAARPCSNPLWCPIARCHARPAARRSAHSRPARLPNWRLARPVAPRRPPRPSALSGRPRPARQQLLRTPPQPAVLLRAFPPRPRASRRCSRLMVRLPALAPATRASGLPAAPLSQTQKASAEDAFGAGLFVMQLTCWASTPCRPPGIERRRARR